MFCSCSRLFLIGPCESYQNGGLLVTYAPLKRSYVLPRTNFRYYVLLHIRIFFLGQIVPGRMGLLVTLFLSLTALLVSTINSSPEVNLSKKMSKSSFVRLLKASQPWHPGSWSTFSSSLEQLWSI